MEKILHSISKVNKIGRFVGSRYFALRFHLLRDDERNIGKASSLLMNVIRRTNVNIDKMRKPWRDFLYTYL